MSSYRSEVSNFDVTSCVARRVADEIVRQIFRNILFDSRGEFFLVPWPVVVGNDRSLRSEFSRVDDTVAI